MTLEAEKRAAEEAEQAERDRRQAEEQAEAARRRQAEEEELRRQRQAESEAAYRIEPAGKRYINNDHKGHDVAVKVWTVVLAVGTGIVVLVAFDLDLLWNILIQLFSTNVWFFVCDNIADRIERETMLRTVS